MTRQIPFIKMHGAGNDFIMIDNRPGYLSGSEDRLIRNLCQRHFGIGADGLMLLQFSEPDHFDLQYFNADGKPAAMCGNGARCAVYMMHLLNPDRKKFAFNVGDDAYRGEIEVANRAIIYWNTPPEIQEIEGLRGVISKAYTNFAVVNSGVPHLVLETASSLDEINIQEEGRYYRYHKLFAPDGLNVNFVQVKNGSVYIRTFERGVEGETLACGTGAVAAAVAVTDWKKLRPPVRIIARGGELQAGVIPEFGAFWLEGPVVRTFEGIFQSDDFEEGGS